MIGRRYAAPAAVGTMLAMMLLTRHWLTTSESPGEPYGRCSNKQVTSQGHRFKASRSANPKWSACPAELMMQRLYDADPARQNKTFVNVGANKGYSSAMWMSLYASETGVTITTWHEHITKAVAKYFGKTKINFCGVCWDCREVYSGKPQSGQGKGGQINIHSIEAMPVNVKLLGHVMDSVRPLVQSIVNLHTHHYAGSNYTGTVKFPKCRLSQEDCSFAGAPGDRGDGKFVDVTVTTVDHFLETHKIDRVEHLKIDTEGWDPLVLQGAQKSIAQKRIRLLEFEYHGLNHWANSTNCKFSSCFELVDVVQKLDASGYVCYMEGSPTMVRLTRCWHENFEIHDWANIACVLRTDTVWLPVLEGMATWLR